MRIIDTHLHLIDLPRFRYPWLDAEPALKRNFTLETYKAQARPAGIESMLHMEVDVTEEDQERETAWVTSLGEGVVGSIAGCRPENRDFPAQLARLAANPKVRGLRRTFHFTPNSLPEQPLFIENIRALAHYGLTYDLCALPRQLSIVNRLAASAPDVQFILDHCGIPDIKSRQLDPWRKEIAKIAALPNVACKISGIVAYADPQQWTVEDLRPFFSHVTQVFGWDRLVWGSDWPVCTVATDLAGWVAATHELIADATDDQKEALLHANARRIYRLPG
jgi:predicted TIM-barrel fold metal-dependent hydrolase